MKIKITLISLLILLSSLGHILEAQTTACVNDTLKLYITDYRGNATWQQSLNGTDWTPLSDTGDTLQLIATQHQYYRTEIIEGTCQPVYSDIIELIINDPPVVTLNPRDSTCLNETAFILSGGSPAGGAYWGDGVVDGKFNPQMAGTGLHELFYSYRDPETHCADTASAMIRVLPLPDEAHAGDDQTDLVVDSVQLDGNSPVNGTGTWTIIEGPGGSFSDLHDPNSWFYKNDTILDYQLRWTIETPCGSNFDEILLNFALLSKNPCPETPLVTDADGNVYPTLQIGNQCWMAKNLNAGVFIPSNSTGTNHSELSDNGIIEKYCLNNNEQNCATYGGLYDWNEVMNYTTAEGGRGICPEGWHIPTNADWQELDNFYKYNDAGIHLKEGGDSGFEGQLAGDRHAQGSFVSFGSSGFFWTSATYTYQGVNEGYYRKLCACNGLLDKGHFSKLTGISVRCIKD